MQNSSRNWRRIAKNGRKEILRISHALHCNKIVNLNADGLTRNKGMINFSIKTMGNWNPDDFSDTSGTTRTKEKKLKKLGWFVVDM
ncbi:hypothetical protein TNCV_1883121 [Trichonephila clavipes]|nr:hypothetical protein TNCV_1883121 [Trichonephila clavipes]